MSETEMTPPVQSAVVRRDKPVSINDLTINDDPMVILACAKDVLQRYNSGKESIMEIYKAHYLVSNSIHSLKFILKKEDEDFNKQALIGGCYQKASDDVSNWLETLRQQQQIREFVESSNTARENQDSVSQDAEACRVQRDGGVNPRNFAGDVKNSFDSDEDNGGPRNDKKNTSIRNCVLSKSKEGCNSSCGSYKNLYKTRIKMYRISCLQKFLNDEEFNSSDEVESDSSDYEESDSMSEKENNSNSDYSDYEFITVPAVTDCSRTCNADPSKKITSKAVCHQCSPKTDHYENDEISSSGDYSDYEVIAKPLDFSVK